MINRTRRTKLGEMLLDVDKYILTVVVIGGFFTPERISVGLILAGFFIAVLMAVAALVIIPPDKEE